MNVLIIDDSKAVRDRLAAALRETIWPLRIATAESVDDVRNCLAEFAPDVVIVDIHLKQGTGFDVLELMNAEGIKPLRIVLTYYALEPYRNKALKLGVDHFLDKSNDIGKAVALAGRCASGAPQPSSSLGRF